MKNRNPYLSLLVLWVIAVCASLISSIVGIIRGVEWQGLFNLVLAVFDGVGLGWCICKFDAYEQFVKTQVEIDKMVNELTKVQKEKEIEPFKEFEENGK